MATGFLHINGTTYELAGQPSDGTIASLRERVQAGHSGMQRVDVTIDHQQLSLTIDIAKVWAAAVWAQESPGPFVA